MLMFKRILEFFFGKKEVQVDPVAPYKVEAQPYVVGQGTVAPAAKTVATPVAAQARKPRKPRANVAAKKIATAKKPAAKKPAN